MLLFEIVIFIFGLSELSVHDKRHLAGCVPALNNSAAMLLRVVSIQVEDVDDTSSFGNVDFSACLQLFPQILQS